jgi:hypothetical protein
MNKKKCENILYGVFILIQINIGATMQVLNVNTLQIPIEEKRRRINEINLAKLESTKNVLKFMSLIE